MPRRTGALPAPARGIRWLLVAGVVAAGLLWLPRARPRAATSYGDWSAPGAVEGGPWQAEVALAADRVGSVHVVWTAPQEGADDGIGAAVHYAVLDGGGWSLPERIPCGPPAIHCSEPAIAVDAIGRVHVVYVRASERGADIVHRMRPAASAGARWTAAETVSAGREDIRRSEPAVAADRVGNVHVVWCDRGANGPDVRYRQLLIDGAWRDVTAVHDPPAGAQTHPSLALAANGTLHAVWIDDRDGAPAVWTSQLPERGFIWWPDAPLSTAADGAPGAPAIAAGLDGTVTALWPATDGDGVVALRAARLTPSGPYWEPARRLWAGENGAVLDVAAAPSPDGFVLVAWTESRPGGRSRLYGGRIGPSASVDLRTRVDGTIRVPAARQPALAVDESGRATLIWEQALDPAAPALLFSRGQLPVPERAWKAVEGFLSFEPALFGCQGDGYRVVACDGSAAASILSDDTRLPPLVGAYVTMEGWLIPDAACERLTAERFAARTPPCDRAASSAIGRLWQDGAPLPGGRVFVGARTAASGRSGRFGLTDLPADTTTVTATAPCALTVSAGRVTLQPRQRLDLGPAAFVRGDVVADCVIDVRDLARVAWNVGRPADEVEGCSDVNGDGIVNVADLDRVRQRLGLRCPMPWAPTPAPPPDARGGARDAR